MKTLTINIDELDKEYLISVFDHETGQYPLDKRMGTRLAALAVLRGFINEQIEAEIDDITNKLGRGYL